MMNIPEKRSTADDGKCGQNNVVEKMNYKGRYLRYIKYQNAGGGIKSNLMEMAEQTFVPD